MIILRPDETKASMCENINKNNINHPKCYHSNLLAVYTCGYAKQKAAALG
jgi:hypothetical protein